MTPKDSLVTVSLHAREAIERRGLDISLILSTAADPEQILLIRAGREVRQSCHRDSFGEMSLIRVVVDVESDPRRLTIITAYRTSRITKYWRNT